MAAIKRKTKKPRQATPTKHDELVAIAATWLRSNHSIVITEMSSGAGEEPDALGFQSCRSTVVECKASRSDFKADSKKSYRREPDRGLGDYRYYLTPTGLIRDGELPDNWGLVEVRNGRPRVKVKAKWIEKDARGELSILASVIRRIGAGALDGVSARVYTIPTKNRATIGIDPESPLLSPADL